MLMPSHIGILMMLIGQGQGDLLDYVPSDTYWQAKHVTVTTESLTADMVPSKEKADIASELAQLGSEQFAIREAARKKIEAAGPAALEQLKDAVNSPEPETARVAKELTTRYAGKGKLQAIRQLMAIRTLGERKEKSVLPALSDLEKSKDPFISQYAHRAVLQIQGKPLAVTVDAAQADADVWYFPKNTGILLQEKANAPVGLSLAHMVETVPEALLSGTGMTKDKYLDDVSQGIITIAEQVGDVRFDGLTLGVGDNVGQNSGWAAFVGRGKFDPDALGAMFENSPSVFDKKLTPTVQGNLRIYEGARDSILILSGDDRLIFIIGPGAEQINPVKESFIKALQAGKGELADSEAMIKAVKQIDTKSAALWGVVATVPDELKKELARKLPIASAVDNAALVATIKEGVIHVSVEGTGTDKAAVAAGVDSLNANISQTVASLKQAPVIITEPMKPLFEFLESLKATAGDQKATLTGELKVDTISLGLGVLYAELRREDAQVRVMEEVPATAPANP